MYESGIRRDGRADLQTAGGTLCHSIENGGGRGGITNNDKTQLVIYFRMLRETLLVFWNSPYIYMVVGWATYLMTASTPSFSRSFWDCLIVFVCLSLWYWEIDVDLIVSVPEFTYILYSYMAEFTVVLLVVFLCIVCVPHFCFITEVWGLYVFGFCFVLFFLCWSTDAFLQSPVGIEEICASLIRLKSDNSAPIEAGSRTSRSSEMQEML